MLPELHLNINLFSNEARCQKRSLKPGMVAQVCNGSSWEVVKIQVPGQPWLHSEIPISRQLTNKVTFSLEMNTKQQKQWLMRSAQ